MICNSCILWNIHDKSVKLIKCKIYKVIKKGLYLIQGTQDLHCGTICLNEHDTNLLVPFSLSVARSICTWDSGFVQIFVVKFKVYRLFIIWFLFFNDCSSYFIFHGTKNHLPSTYIVNQFYLFNSHLKPGFLKKVICMLDLFKITQVFFLENVCQAFL